MTPLPFFVPPGLDHNLKALGQIERPPQRPGSLLKTAVNKGTEKERRGKLGKDVSRTRI